MKGHHARYAIGWAITAGLLLFALTKLVPGVVGGERGVVLPAVGVAAAADFLVFSLVLRALDAEARMFSLLWGFSIVLKVLLFGSAIAIVAISGSIPLDAFVRVLVVSFVAFAHHEIFCLLVRARRLERRAATAGNGGI